MRKIWIFQVFLLYYNMDNINNLQSGTGTAPAIAAANVPLDYVNSGNAAEIDKGIRDTIKGIRISILAMGIGLAKIKSNGLYSDLKFRSMNEYIEHLSDETKMERSGIFKWLYIGEAYLKHRSELEMIGFSDDDGPSKLRFLEHALTQRQKQEVFNKIKTMSLREFIDYAKGEPAKTADDTPYVSIRGNNVYVEGKLAIILSKNIDKRVSAYFKKVIRAACEALEAEEVILPVRLNNRKEAKCFSRLAEQLKAKMRRNM